MPADSETFKARDAASYDSVADRFDYWTTRVSESLAGRVVSLARIRPGQRVLDVGTGSGIVAIAAARQAGVSAEIVGVDLSQGMLKIARSKTRVQGAASFCKMDAEHLAFTGDSFDAVVSLFALLHFPSPERALREMFRVLKPGGRVAIGVGSRMPLSWSALPTLLARWRESRNHLIAPQALDRFVESRLPKASQYETIAHLETRSIESLLRISGFQDLQTEWKGYAHLIGNPTEFWDLQTTFSSMVRKRLESAPAAVVEQLRQEFHSKCEAVLRGGGKLIYRNAAKFVSARK